ncbi:MAG: hypothetical protein Q8N22_02965 [bacterium]|nr:hypothetical protein [bacterium]
MPKTKQVKSNQELTFLIVAVLMLIILITVISWNLGFLAKNLNMALNPNVLKEPTVDQFNIDGFKALGLTKSL